MDLMPLDPKHDARLTKSLAAFDAELDAWKCSPSIRGVDAAVAQLSFWTEAAASVSIENEPGMVSDIAEASTRYGSAIDSIQAAANTTRAMAYASGAVGLNHPGRTSATDTEFVGDLHHITMNKLLDPEKLGEWRWNDVDVMDSRTGLVAHTGCDPEKLDDTMTAWSDAYAADAWHGRHPILRAGMAHLEFERIHPFADGNGRTGRVLIAAMTMEDGLPALPTSKIFEQHRGAYHAVMTDAIAQKKPELWAEFFVETQIHALRHLRQTTKEVTQLVAGMEKALPDELTPAKRRTLALDIVGMPVATAAQIAKLSRLPEEVVETAFDRLQKDGFGGRLASDPTRFVARSALEIAERPYQDRTSPRKPEPTER